MDGSLVPRKRPSLLGRTKSCLSISRGRLVVALIVLIAFLLLAFTTSFARKFRVRSSKYIHALQKRLTGRERRVSASVCSLETGICEGASVVEEEGPEIEDADDDQSAYTPTESNAGSSSLGITGKSTPGDGAANPSRKPADDTDPIVIVYTACGNPNEIEDDHHGLISLKSLLMAKSQRPAGSSRRYDVHVMSNVGDEELFNTTQVNYDVWRAVQADPWVDVTVHHIEDIEAAAASAGITNHKLVPQTFFKNCAASRLKLPFLLHQLAISKAIYIDWDTVTLCDLTRLWDEFKAFPTEAFMGFAQSDPTQQSELDHYRVWDQPRHPVHGSINSGVMLLHATRAISNKDLYWSTVMQVMGQRVDLATADYWALTKAFPLGDQDVINMMMAVQPKWMHLLPWQYNYCLEYDRQWPLPHKSGEIQMPCILHFCGNKLQPVNAGEATQPITNPWKAAYSFIRHWNLVPHERPPGVRDPAAACIASRGTGC